MEYVRPIKEIEVIFLMKRELKKQSSRNYLLFVMEINTGLRISEILSLSIKDVYQNREPVDFLKLKREDVYLNAQVKRALRWFGKKHPFSNPESYLFLSSRGKTAISRQQAYRIINRAAENVGLSEKIGPHTLRKTFGYHAYKKGIAVSLIQRRFCHHTPAETLRYIGINKEQVKPQLDINL
ncbi:tyrosine-type recombinase/integrase [Alteribacillus bidgolensis]|uniref:Phage integrase family protein n=1 Tax=Alteribacillus bidgolensis TaxID=930129 RepID=A0A1G8IL51_9BACI|nr:tyrosine-type recombinase/integrase [Alteribacillus bidgolensis]SDI19613.1 Phage integrase family protein [Alteribacillus bidgolensis]